MEHTFYWCSLIRVLGWADQFSGRFVIKDKSFARGLLQGFVLRKH